MTDSRRAFEPSAARPRNPGRPFEAEAVLAISIDQRDLERRARTLSASSRGREVATADLLAIIASLDLTALEGDESVKRIQALCAAARWPLADALVQRLGPLAQGVRVAAVCVHARRVPPAVAALRGSGIPVAAVAGGFPRPFEHLAPRVAEVRRAVEHGASEIDLVMRRESALAGAWDSLYRELRELRQASGTACLKVILAVGDLPELTTVARASRVALMAGADFLKTSTGRDRAHASLAAGLVMADALAAHHAATGVAAGLKPAGGIRTARQALQWLDLVATTLGSGWVGPERFRIGASGLLDDVVHELENHVSGEG
jgi:deoxyribose-phosphate aldolase